MQSTDAQLLKAFEVNGDERAFQELAQRYLGMIYNAALRRTGQPQLAEEAAQNVLSLLVRKAPDISKEPSRLASWLHRAATWEAANLLRAEQRHRMRTRAIMEEPASDSSSQENQMEEALRHLDSCLLRLSAGDRQLVILHYLQGKKHREIAEAIGKSESAVQRQCHRCLRKLAGLLGSHGVKISCGTLGGLLATEAAKGMTDCLATQLATFALPPHVASSLPTTTQSILLMTTNHKIVLTAVAVSVIAAVPIWRQHVKIKELEQSNRQTSAMHLNSQSVGVGDPEVSAGVSVRAELPQMDSWAMKDLVSSNWNRRGAGTNGIRILASVVENTTPENIDGLLEALETVKASGKDTTTAERIFWERIGEVDGKKWMTASIPEHPDDPPNTNTKRCLTGWGSVDPQGAIAWFNQLEEGTFKESLTASVLTGASWNDSAVAFEFMTGLPNDVQLANRDTIAQNLTHNEDNSAADRWVASLERSGTKEEAELAFDSLFRTMIRRNMDNAVSWLSGEVGKSYFDDRRKSQLVGVWASNDPNRAAEWAVSTSNPDLLTQVARSCPPSKFNAFGAWLGSRSEEAYYPVVVKTFADRIETTDPESAATWRASVAKAVP